MVNSSKDKLCLLVRDPQKAARLFDPEIILRQFDLTQFDEKSFAGIHSLLWILPNNYAELNFNEEAWLELAKTVGIKHIVKLSVMGVPKSNLYCRHKLSEEYIENSGINFTHLRSNTFMQNFNNYELEDIRDRHELRFLSGGKNSFVDTRDIGAVAAEILLHPEHHSNAVYTLTGPEALSFSEAAMLFSEVLGKEIRYIDITNSTDPKDKFKQNHPIFPAIKKGEYALVTHEIEKILKRPALSLKQYIHDYIKYFI